MTELADRINVLRDEVLDTVEQGDRDLPGAEVFEAVVRQLAALGDSSGHAGIDLTLHDAIARRLAWGDTEEAVLGDAMKDTPISSNKSMIGHTLTAAGAIEAIFSIKTIEEGILPPTINYQTPDPEIAFDVVPNTARRQQVTTVLSNSFGFGGQNACLVIAAEPA